MLVAAALLVAIHWPSDPASKMAAGSPDSVSGPASGSPESAPLPVSFEPLAAKDWERGQPTYAEDPDILPGLSNKFNPLS
ncbi:hypothetical protein MXD81_19985, partial [Microbacteriaceae bacterium K1510]|nr:hypothetical protein [Microbacteriaceae bacterium K1510]